MSDKSKIYVRNKLCLSWLCSTGSKVLSRTLERRLTQKLAIDKQKTKRSLFVTLTFDRAKYGDKGDPRTPERLWDEACEGDGHLKPFIRALTKATGKTYKGKWIAKREFQAGGYLHYHVLFYDVGYIGHDAMMKAWGRGGVNFRRVDHGSASYLAKYHAKDGAIPGWLYEKTGRTLKFVSTSPGFWSDLDALKEPVTRRYHPTPERRKPFNPAGVPQFLLIERARNAMTLTVGRRSNRQTFELNGDAASFAICAISKGLEYERYTHGAYCFVGNIEDARYIASLVQNNKNTKITSYMQLHSSRSVMSSGGVAACGDRDAALLDNTHKNGDAETVVTRYPTMIEAYGPTVLHALDPDYMMSGRVRDPLMPGGLS
jgi:hypothetical protein